MRLRSLVAAATCSLAAPLAGPLAAQNPYAAEAITPEAVLRHVGIIADDSMQGRATPSTGLDRTAKYVADQFAQLGLRPGLGDSSWFQYYPVSPRLDFARSKIVLKADTQRVSVDLVTAARLARPTVPAQPVRGAALVVSGPHTTQTLPYAANRDKVVLYVAPPDLGISGRMAVVDALLPGNRGVIILSEADTALFLDRLRSAQRQPIVRIEDGWGVHVHPERAGVKAVLAAGGLDLDRARQDTMPAIRELSGLEVAFEPALDRSLPDNAVAPNVVGIIPGTDTALRNEYVVYSAHMDHTGISRGKADSIDNGYDDNAAGVAGLIELAKAFTRPGARPRRPVILLATSAAMHGVLGSRYFASHLQAASEMRMMMIMFGAASQLSTAIVNINLDRIGRNSGGAVMINGLSEVRLATPAAWIATAHPDLGVTVSDGGPTGTPESDHYAFVRAGVPSLSLHTSPFEHAAPVSDSLDAIDPGHLTRVLQYAFYLGRDIANASGRPQWTPDGRREYLSTREE